MNANLDPRALAAANYIKYHKDVFSEGPIIPCWLGMALPPRSERRGWRDYVALFILSDIISAHRLKDGKVFFRRPLYQVNREEWAKLIPTTLKEVSLTLTWLADDLGVIGRVQRVRLVDGQPKGSQTFAWPIGPRLQEMVDYFFENGHAMSIPYHEQASSNRGGTAAGVSLDEGRASRTNSLAPARAYDVHDSLSPPAHRCSTRVGPGRRRRSRRRTRRW